MANTFAQQLKQSNLDNAATRHMMVLRSENINHPEVKRVFSAIPAVYRKDSKWDSEKCEYVAPHTGIYLDASQHSSIATISIVLNGLEGFGCVCPTADAVEIANHPETDPRLVKLLKVYIGDEWEALHPTHNTWSVDHRGLTFSFNKEVPTTTKETHPSVRWLRKQGKVWDLDHHMNNPLRIRVAINAYVKEDNETCRIEVTEVREEIIKTEIKRLVCA